MNLATLAAAFAISTLGASPALHPHSVKNSADAIATAFENFNTRFPEAKLNELNWPKIFQAREYAGMWEVKSRDGLRTIYIDPSDGHIISIENVTPDMPQ